MDDTVFIIVDRQEQVIFGNYFFEDKKIAQDEINKMSAVLKKRLIVIGFTKFTKEGKSK